MKSSLLFLGLLSVSFAVYFSYNFREKTFKEINDYHERDFGFIDLNNLLFDVCMIVKITGQYFITLFIKKRSKGYTGVLLTWNKIIDISKRNMCSLFLLTNDFDFT